MTQESASGFSVRLRARVLSLGADAVGIAPALLPEVPEGGARAYFDWIAAGMHGEMDYMARKPMDRCEITRWFPPARSVILCAFSYHDGKNLDPREENDFRRGRFARYSLPPDYHDELKSRMKSLLAWYAANSPASHGEVPRGKLFVDTNPVLERLYARFAGIGWVGKNAMILSRKIGSFFLLAGIAVDRELDYDQPVEPHCGTCTRCLDACPTGAFPKPHLLDASRCVANFTVEQRKSPIPEAFRAGHGNWVFGCDACQDVCPWNRFARKSSVFAYQRARTEPLAELAALTPEEFKRRYRGTSLERTGYAAFLRNVLLAMGNSKNAAFRPDLERFASHPDPLLAEQARWSLARIGENANLIE